MFKKNWFGKILLPLLMCVIAVAVIIIGTFYFNFISKRIYDDSTDHLTEIYSQVNRSFGAFLERNWGLLEGWEDYLSENGAAADSTVSDYLKKEQEYWGFSEFYFLSEGGACMTPDGAAGNMTSEAASQISAPIMTSETLPDGSEVILFAVPATRSEYKGFGYDAVAISYTNADMASSLNVDAFSGKARCFVIRGDGSVLLSTQTGGNVFGNYMAYLKAASDLNEDDLSGIQNDWQSGVSGLLNCKIGDVEYCISYQPVGYQDYVMLSAVPQSVISAGFLSVQKTTINVLIIIFLLVFASVIVLLILRARRQSRKDKTELKYRERMFDVLSNNVDDIFIMLDSEQYNVDYISPNIERLLGIPVSEARENIKVLQRCAPGVEVVIPRDEFEAIPIHGSRNREYEYTHQSTGERRWYRMTIYHMDIQNIKKYIVVLSDRTQERQMNQKLREALTAAKSANEAKSNFLSNMSHDIRTPMNAIVGFSVLLEKDADKPEKVREYTRKITASGHHLLSLINDVLDMSKIESGKTSLNVDVFSLPEMLEELNIILAPQAKAKRQDFKTHVSGTPPERLIGDKLRLNQILINLLSNAIKYTPEGGKVEFRVCDVSDSAGQYAKLRFIVKDNGIGMSGEFLEQIFNPFSREVSSATNKIQGTGLGMAITKNLVDLMGGIIHVDSSLGKGSTFTVEMSFAYPEQDESESWIRQKVSSVLVTDDDEEICLNIRDLMIDAGMKVEYETNGAAAVETAVKAHEKGMDFDVILLDWKMPGMDGVETARKIRERVGSDIPILVLTSYDWSDIEAEAREAGINAFMPKPFFASTFWQTIKPLFIKNSEQRARKDSRENVMKGLHFLIAEDNDLNAEILTEMLSMEGATSERAADGREAVDMFEKSEPGSFDMVLMDVQMPVMNGYDATRAIISSSHPEAAAIPIVAMTANTFAEDVKNALDSGMNGHLSKPLDMNAAKELIGDLTNKNNISGQSSEKGE